MRDGWREDKQETGIEIRKKEWWRKRDKLRDIEMKKKSDTGLMKINKEEETEREREREAGRTSKIVTESGRESNGGGMDGERGRTSNRERQGKERWWGRRKERD